MSHTLSLICITTYFKKRANNVSVYAIVGYTILATVILGIFLWGRYLQSNA